jgi:cytochrome P450
MTEFLYDLSPLSSIAHLALAVRCNHDTQTFHVNQANPTSKSLICILSWGIYHAPFHPLSPYPGPKLWTAYRLPFAWSNIRGQLPFKVLEFHRKYGLVVRIAPNELAFTDPEAWNDIYGMQAGRVQNPKDPFASTPQVPGFDSNIIHAHDTKHACLRRIYGQAFTPKAVEEQRPCW